MTFLEPFENIWAKRDYRLNSTARFIDKTTATKKTHFPAKTNKLQLIGNIQNK